MIADDGPWGSRAWTYDRLGNQLTVTEPRPPTPTGPTLLAHDRPTRAAAATTRLAIYLTTDHLVTPVLATDESGYPWPTVVAKYRGDYGAIMSAAQRTHAGVDAAGTLATAGALANRADCDCP